MTSDNTNDQSQANKQASIYFTIGQLQCIQAYHWSIVLYDVIFYQALFAASKVNTDKTRYSEDTLNKNCNYTDTSWNKDIDFP